MKFHLRISLLVLLLSLAILCDGFTSSSRKKSKNRNRESTTNDEDQEGALGRSEFDDDRARMKEKADDRRGKEMRERDRERKENRQEEEEESEEDDKDKDKDEKTKSETRTRRELSSNDESYSSPRRNRREEQKMARAKEMNDGSKLDHGSANTGRDTTGSPNRRRREQREWDESSIDTDHTDYRHSHRRRQVEVQTKPDVGQEEENREGRVQPHRGLAAAGGQDSVPMVDKVSRKGMAAAGGAAASSSSEEEDKKKQNKGAKNTDDGVPLVDKVSRKGMAAVEKKQSSSESAEGKVKPHRGLAAAGTNQEDDRPRNRRHLTSKFVPSSIHIDREKLNERDGDDFWIAPMRQPVDDSSEYAVKQDERRNTQRELRSNTFGSSSSEQTLSS